MLASVGYVAASTPGNSVPTIPLATIVFFAGNLTTPLRGKRLAGLPEVYRVIRKKREKITFIRLSNSAGFPGFAESLGHLATLLASFNLTDILYLPTGKFV